MNIPQEPASTWSVTSIGLWQQHLGVICEFLPAASHRMLSKGRPSESYYLKSVNEPLQRPMENGNVWPTPANWLRTLRLLFNICETSALLSRHHVADKGLVRKPELLHVLDPSRWLRFLHILCPLRLRFLHILCPLCPPGQPPTLLWTSVTSSFCVPHFLAVQVFSHL